MIRPLRAPVRFAAAAVVSLGLFGFVAPSAQAGWDNVFQVACWHCKPRERREYVPPPSVRPSTQTSRYETRYEDREMEETVTVMKPEYTKEPVDVQVRSYTWDPITTYTQRSYKNPATGCVETISEPRTSFVRKEDCQTVTKYVERMKMVPVQEKRRYIERTPVTTYYGPTTRYYPRDCDSCGLPPANRAPQVEAIPGAPPRVDSDRLKPQDIPTRSNSKFTTPAPAPGKSNPPVNARTTALAATSAVRGEVVGANRLPQAGIRLVFLNAADFSDLRYAKADAYGNFAADLPAGQWLVYVGTSADQATQTKTQFTLGNYDTQTVTVAIK